MLVSGYLTPLKTLINYTLQRRCPKVFSKVSSTKSDVVFDSLCLQSTKLPYISCPRQTILYAVQRLLWRLENPNQKGRLRTTNYKGKVLRRWNTGNTIILSFGKVSSDEDGSACSLFHNFGLACFQSWILNNQSRNVCKAGNFNLGSAHPCMWSTICSVCDCSIWPIKIVEDAAQGSRKFLREFSPFLVL